MITIIFDLDNTLYDVKQYFTGAFDHVSKYISTKYNLDEKKDIFRFNVEMERKNKYVSMLI